MGMTLEQALADAQQGGGRRLVVDVILDTMDDNDRAVLLAALAGPMPSARLSRALEAVGHTVGEGALNTWRARNRRVASA